MGRPAIHIMQLGTGARVNLLPLAAGQLLSRLKQEREIVEEFDLGQIIFAREDPEAIAARLENVAVLGVSCFLWNTNHSLAAAEAVHRRFPGAVVVVGGPSIPKEPGEAERFLAAYPFVDVICREEGEEVFAAVCREARHRPNFSSIPGIIYRTSGGRLRWNEVVLADLGRLPSPYVDGTFDEFYRLHERAFSGIILETNRGCPYRCSYCTWGNQAHEIREKPDAVMAAEVEWLGRHRVRYIAMSDANFGIRARDLQFVRLLAECKQRYGVPDFLSVSWVKNSSERVLAIAEILQRHEIGFRVTLSLQSLHRPALKVARRANIRREAYLEIKEAYRDRRLYSYTELILGLPMESYSSYIEGLERCLSASVFDQLYIYPLFLFPNTEMSSRASRERYRIESRMVECVYTKSKIDNRIKERVEIVIGHSTLSSEEWVEAFALGYLVLALHDDRLAFFVFHYLRKELSVSITDMMAFIRGQCRADHYPALAAAFRRLEQCADDVVKKSSDHLIRPRTYHDVPFDPADGVFLEILLDKEQFLAELQEAACDYLSASGCSFRPAVVEVLFRFQSAVIAAPQGLASDLLRLKHNWIEYFGYTFHLPEKELRPAEEVFRVVDIHPCEGDRARFLAHHFDVRGVPAFNLLYRQDGSLAFPPVPMQHLKAPARFAPEEQGAPEVNGSV